MARAVDALGRLALASLAGAAGALLLGGALCASFSYTSDAATLGLFLIAFAAPGLLALSVVLGIVVGVRALVRRG